jgi:hypothetical protein
MNTHTFEITFAGKTMPVTFTVTAADDANGNERVIAWNFDTFAARIGRGAKAYRAAVMAVRLYDGMNENVRKSYGRRGAPIVTDAEGRQWGINLTNTTVRNRQATIIGWADDYRDTTTAAAHDDYSTIR